MQGTCYHGRVPKTSRVHFRVLTLWFQASPKRTPIGPSKRRRAHAYA